MPNLIDQLSSIAARRCAVDDDERQLIHVAFLAGWSYQQIGEVLGVSRQAVAQKVARERGRRPAERRLVDQAAARAAEQARFQREEDEYLESILGPKETWRWRRDM